MNIQHIQLNVPLSFNQVVEIVKQLSLKEKIKLKELLQEMQDIEDIEITEEHKEIVRQRCRASEKKPSRLLKWNEAKHKIKF